METDNQTPVVTESYSTEPQISETQIQFHAKTSEFFSIWITNLLLTIVTFGIYSAWAKVRTLKYLYGNIEVNGARFDYHARPIQILKGRILVGALFGIYFLCMHFIPEAIFVIGFLYALLMPFLVVQALAFHFGNTSYRNIRFGFQRDYKESYLTSFKVFVIWLFTLGLGFPYALYRVTHFRLNRIRFGLQKFTFEGGKSEYVRLYYSCLGVIVLAGFLSGLIGFVLGSSGGLIAAFAMYGVYFVIFGISRALAYNLVSEYTTAGPIKFKSTLNGWELVGVYFTNILGCVLTFGLATPWALLRTMKYRLDHTVILAPANALDQIAATSKDENGNAIADAAVDINFIDIGI